jgi:outer membrane protein assembly factor BamA
MNQSSLWHQVFISILMFWCVSVCAQVDSNCHEIVVLSQNKVDKEVIKNLFSVPVVIDELSIESDIVFKQDEFFHLFSVAKGDFIDQEQLIFGLELLAKKNKFSIVRMRSVFSNNGVALHFIMEAIWTFKKIKIHNIYQRKHALLQFYLMERGDLFDESKHNHSITKIKDFLIHNGYFDCNVTSSLEYDYQTKEVIAHISVKKGKCYYFGLINVEITIDDVTHDENEELRKIVKKKLSHALSSRVFTKEQLNNEVIILKDYLAKKGFFHSIIEFKQELDRRHAIVNVKWKITIQQKREIVFFGHRFFSKKELFDQILAFGQSVCLLPASLLAEEIVRAYKSKGFLNVEVVTQEEKERSFFIIKEGPRTIIRSIEIKNRSFGNVTVIRKQCFGKLLKNSYYDAQLYDEAIALLTNYYFNQGFHSFVVVNHEFVPATIENEYVLAITIDEGTQKHITCATVEGYPELNEQAPFKKREFVDSVVPFTNKIIDEQRAWLVNHFQALGFLHPKFKAVIEAHSADVTIKWIVDTGEKVRFGKTVLIGSSSFPFSYLERLLCYKEGDLWSQKKIKQTFRALKELEIFETIHFFADYTLRQAPSFVKTTEGRQGERSDENKPVLLKLHLDDRYEIRTRAGLELQHVRKYQTFSGITYKLGGTALIKNPSNCADQIRFDCDFARSHREIIGKYRRPWFTRSPFFTTLQVYSIVYDQPAFIGSFNDLYTLIQNGFFLGIQKKSEHFDFTINNGFEWMKMRIKDNPVSLAQAIDFKPQLIDKLVPFFFIEPTVMFEWLDDLLNPSRGGVSLFSLKGMLPLKKKYKDSSFFKLLCEQSVFIPLKMVVGALRFRCGHIFYREFSAIMPSERFYLGGSHSLRGYDADLAPPLGIFIDDEQKDHIVPRGGRSMVNANIELRIPVLKKVGAVLFQDLGALSGTMFADFKPQDILASTGFGVRIFTPLGPLRFDMGWKWRKQIPSERSFAWYLTFGQAF